MIEALYWVCTFKGGSLKIMTYKEGKRRGHVICNLISFCVKSHR